MLLLLTQDLSVPRVCGGDPRPGRTIKFIDAVFPAYAGVIPEDGKITVNDPSVPRVCGGDPESNNIIDVIVTCSPRMRG